MGATSSIMYVDHLRNTDITVTESVTKLMIQKWLMIVFQFILQLLSLILLSQEVQNNLNYHVGLQELELLQTDWLTLRSDNIMHYL